MRVTSSDFTSMFGMHEMEVGVADIVNKAHDDCCLVEDVHFTAGDLKSDPDAFNELRSHGWFAPVAGGQHRLCMEAVRRIKKRYPNA